MGLGQEFLQLRVLSLELAQALDLMNLHSPKLRTPAVERRIAETVLTAQLPHWHPGLGFLQKSDDLLLGKPPLLHVRFSSQKRTLLTYRWYRLRGAGHMRKMKIHLVGASSTASLTAMLASAIEACWIESLSAGIAAHAAVLDEIKARPVAVRVGLWNSWRRSQDLRARMIRGKAYKAFISAGGSRANFIRILGENALIPSASQRYKGIDAFHGGATTHTAFPRS